jgi:hypothetical protein
MRRYRSIRCRRSLSMVAAFALALLVAAPALADGVAPGDANAAQKKEATDHFMAGKAAFEAKNWEKSIAELRASLNVVNSPNARLELARSLRESGALGDAWTEYGRVVDDATGLAATEARYAKTADAATAERTEVEAKITFITITVVHAPDGAVLKVGGRSIPSDQWTKPVISMPGAVDVVLTDAAGKELARQTVAATGGQQSSVTIDGLPAPPPALPAAANPDDKPDFSQAPPPAATPSSGRAYLRPWAYGAGAVGVVGFGLFTAFGLMSNSDYNDLKSSCVGGHCPSSKSGEISDGKTFQTVANVGLVAGIVGIAAGGTLFALSFTGKSGDTTGLLVGPSYVGYRGNL